MGLEIVNALRLEPSLKGYYLLSSVRGDFLMEPGRIGEACEKFTRAAALTRNERERKLLLRRAADSFSASCRTLLESEK